MVGLLLHAPHRGPSPQPGLSADQDSNRDPLAPRSALSPTAGGPPRFHRNYCKVHSGHQHHRLIRQHVSTF